MHFYRSLQPIRALTFDLDDTLYDNEPFMVQAVNKMMEKLIQIDGLQDLQLTEYNQIKRNVLLEQPEIYYDVVAWRIESFKKLLLLKGFRDLKKIDHIADEVMDTFTFWRNQVIVPDSALQALTTLAEKYPLAVITNGNADIEQIGLKDYFQFSLRGGGDALSKPFSDIFKLASSQLNIPIENILHVGDNVVADVQGAINSGMQACWINVTGKDIYHQTDSTLLPHIEIEQLSELNNLL